MANYGLLTENNLTPTLTNTNITCNDGNHDQTLYEYTAGINKWHGYTYLNDFMKLGGNIDLSDNLNSCQKVNTNDLVNPPNTNKTSFYLSYNNIQLLSQLTHQPTLMKFNRKCYFITRQKLPPQIVYGKWFSY